VQLTLDVPLNNANYTIGTGMEASSFIDGNADWIAAVTLLAALV
jgi:hypothetical protein